jgi:hypothetical protein
LKGKITEQDTLATTIETDLHYPQYMGNTPHPYFRYIGMQGLKNTMVTIEPIMDFDLREFIEMIYSINPFQVNIGADTSHNHLPEPLKEKVLKLIAELEKFTTVKQKSNLSRILKI